MLPNSSKTPKGLRIAPQWTRSRYSVQDIHEPRLKVKDENVGWKHTCSACSHAGFEWIGSRSGYNPVQDYTSYNVLHLVIRIFVTVNSYPGRYDANLRFRGYTSTDAQFRRLLIT